jgi:hypothetical protein
MNCKWTFISDNNALIMFYFEMKDLKCLIFNFSNDIERNSIDWIKNIEFYEFS